jgi:putative PIN family toxin of toxin-antitoxin system
MMSSAERLVLDTNVILSGLLFSGSTPRRALLKAQNGQLIGSDETLLELVQVMGRPRFDRYLERSVRQRLVAEFMSACEVVPILYSIRACRDTKDDKFLEVAVHGQADAIVTGDRDLLDLNPFRGIGILTPREYVEGS